MPNAGQTLDDNPEKAHETSTGHRVALLPGDGVGPEVIAAARAVLEQVARLDGGVSLRFEVLPWGSAYYLEHGRMAPASFLRELGGFDAILLGAVGDPRVPDHESLWGLLLPVRQHFDQYVNLRPIRLLPGVKSPISGLRPGAVDMLFVRENTEGEYAGKGASLYQGTEREVALQIGVFSRHGVERVVRFAFEQGRRLGRSVTSISKGNALNFSGVFWDRVFHEVAEEYPDVEQRSYLVDAAALYMVQDPSRFGVVVASNLFGDILTDLGAGIVGGLGLAASANLNPERRYPSMFEPVHGSAPDLAGTGKANPVAAIWAGAMMLEHLGYPRWGDAVLHAVESVLAAGKTTPPDLGGSSSTEEVADAVTRQLTLAAEQAGL